MDNPGGAYEYNVTTAISENKPKMSQYMHLMGCPEQSKTHDFYTGAGKWKGGRERF